jgi:hypothetical protein
VTEGRKQAVSLRLSAGDIRKIKRLGKRLGVRDSDVIRYALKVTLAKLAPLCDPSVRGRHLMPVFIDTGTDVLQHFELDAEQLESIINDGAENEHRVATEDIQLMAMMGMQRSYARLSLREIREHVAAGAPEDALEDTLSTSFRRHLYAKYVAAQHNGTAMPGAALNGAHAAAAPQPHAADAPPPPPAGDSAIHRAPPKKPAR